MKYNKVSIELKDYKKLHFRDTNNCKIEKIDTQIENFEFKDEFDLGLINCKIIDIKPLSTTWREVYNVKLNIKENFTPGDSVGVLCPNKNEFIEQILEILNLPNECYSIERDGRNGFKFKGRLTDFFKYVFDFNSLPKKATLMKLANGNKHLEYLSSREGSLAYFEMIKNWNNLIDIIKSFNCKPKLEDLINGCETIKPRYYSLTNKLNEEWEILVGIVSKNVEIVDDRGDTGNEMRYGHFSQFVKSPNGDIKACLRPSTLIQQVNTIKTLIICTGTGIAPFLSFLKNKKKEQQYWIIYGFRNTNDDLYNGVYENTVVTRLMSSKGEYVTSYLKITLDKILDYTEFDCCVYVCGRMEMQKEVYHIFREEIPKIIEEKRLFFDNWQ